MKEEKDYIRDLAEIRSMMERTSKFLSLSGLAGVMAGIYALAGSFVAYQYLGFQSENIGSDFSNIMLLALAILLLTLSTAFWFSYKKANKRNEKLWNPTAKRLLLNMMVPLIAGGCVLMILIAKDLTVLVPPCSLIFYGIALYSSGKFTYEDIKSLGVLEILLGLFSLYFTEYALLSWALGFGLLHIVYGVYVHYRYER